MSLGKQAKTITKKQGDLISSYLRGKRSGLRNETIFLLSYKSGLRAKEIASLKWSMVLDSDGSVSETINLTDTASKGKSGRVIPLHCEVRDNLVQLKDDLISSMSALRGDDDDDFYDNYVIRTERSEKTSPQVIVNMFAGWYREMGLVGCSSHSGRRSFITETAKKVSQVGGSLRDVQVMVGHKSLNTTQRYIDYDTDAQRKLVALL